MEYKIVSFRELAGGQVLELAQLHHAVVHSLLTELGLPFLERYYRFAQDDISVLGFCAISENRIPLGWVMGSPKPEQLNGRLRESLPWFIAQMFRLLFTRPLVLWQLALSVVSSNQPDMSVASIELTYIGVAKEKMGIGLGTKLIHYFIEASRKAEYYSIVLSVEVENEPAIALYKKAGFEISKTFSEGRYQRHRMEKRI
jgi:ribosomal protein S18 acetylase RimI-like enzyme